jgi:hypothetical protein
MLVLLLLLLLLQDIRDLDDVSFADWWKSHGGNEHSLQRMWDPIGEQQLPTAAAATVTTFHSTRGRRRCVGSTQQQHACSGARG